MKGDFSYKSVFLKSLRRFFSDRLVAGLTFVVLLAAFLGYGLEFIERTSFEVDGEKTYALFDDAMISMQYAKNFSNGYGLVWNAGGERVEGYSNPLWVLTMTGIHMFPIPITQTSYYLKLVSLSILALNLVVVLLIVKVFTESKLIPLLAVFLTAFYYPLNNWSLHGMEVGFMALLINATLWTFLRAWREKSFSPLVYVIMSLSILLRMDATVIALSMTIGMAWIDRPHRKQHLKWGFSSMFLALAGLTLFRLMYYNAWLPNTAYLKLGGISVFLRISLGLKLWWDFVWNSNWALFLMPLSLLLLNRRKELILLFSIVLGQMAYSVFIGGDSWEHVGGANRFIAPVMPLFFIIFVLALWEIYKLLITKTDLQSGLTKFIGAIMLVSFTVMSLISFNTLNVNDYFQVWTLEKKPVFTASVERYAGMGLTLGRLTTADAVIAVVTAGNIPYFSERTSIDLLGKNDSVVSKGEARINSSLFHPGNFRPGHNKWDYEYSIGVLSPDVVAQIWENTENEIAPYLVGYVKINLDGIPYYFRQDSNNVRWDLIQSISK